MDVSCECCALSSKVLCDGPIARPESLPSAVRLSVIATLQQLRGLGPLRQSRREKKKITLWRSYALISLNFEQLQDND
jgi:hypothetical protein